MADERSVWERRIAEGYRRAEGRDLAVADELYAHPWAVLCHDTGPDPLFVYANLTAQRLWERPLTQFVGWPSRFTAPEEERAARAAALREGDVVRGYQGVRISASGRRFRISDAMIFTVTQDGLVVGQAAVVPRWEYLPD